MTYDSNGNVHGCIYFGSYIEFNNTTLNARDEQSTRIQTHAHAQINRITPLRLGANNNVVFSISMYNIILFEIGETGAG